MMMCLFRKVRSLSALFLSILLTAPPLLSLARAVGRTGPPTIDPTYGRRAQHGRKQAAAVGSQAQWIWVARTADNQRVLAQHTLSLSRLPRTAKIDVTADDFFLLWINGQYVDSSHPGPDGDLVWKHVHQQEITKFLHEGENTIAIEGQNAAGPAGILAQVEAGGKILLQTDATWQVQELPGPANEQSAPPPAGNPTNAGPATVLATLSGGPWAAAGGVEGWPGYVALAPPYLAHLPLRPVAVEGMPAPEHHIDGLATLKRKSGKVRVVVPMLPMTDARQNSGILLDFGQELTGRIEIEAGNVGTVLVGTGESREEALKAPWSGLHRLDLAPGRKAVTPYSAFRYVHLVFPAVKSDGAATPLPLVLTHLSLDHLYYPVEYKGSFACSDPLLTRIWYTGAYTAHLCMQDDIWDAPKRDRLRWIGDMHVSGAVINLAFADRFLMEQTLQRLRDDAQGSKPASELPGSHVNGIPGYSCAWICTLADFHRHLGDDTFLNKQHDALISLLEFFRGELDARNVFVNQRMQWPFVDWAPEFNGDTPQARASTQLFFIQALRDAEFLLMEMGDSANAAKYAQWREQLIAAAQQYLPDPVTRLFSDRRQENAMAIYSGTAEGSQKQAIYNAVLRPGAPAWDYIATPYYNNYVIYAMSQAGHTQDALDFIRSYWGGMLAEGATSFWEGYDPRWDKNDFHAHLQADNGMGYFVSLCHGWSAGATSFLTERVLGVRPTGGGFKTVTIAPELGDLQWAEGDVPTPKGTLHLRGVKQPGGTIWTLTIPSGMDATITLPGSPQQIRLNGVPVGPQALQHLSRPGKYTLITSP